MMPASQSQLSPAVTDRSREAHIRHRVARIAEQLAADARRAGRIADAVQLERQARDFAAIGLLAGDPR